MPKDKEIKQLVELVPLEFDEYAKKYGSGENYLNYILHQIAMNLTRLAVTNALMLDEMVEANEEEYEDVEP